MTLNVLSRKQALQQGLQPWLYSYQPANIPLGQVEAVLDFKLWAQQVMGIGCYFTQTGTGKKFLLTVYCQRSGIYAISGSPIDFTCCPVATEYRLKIWLQQDSRKICFTPLQ